MEEIYDAIEADKDISDLSEYSSEYHQQISNEWDHICNSLTNSTIFFASEARYRLAFGDIEQQKDYWPAEIQHCPRLLSFIRTILIEQFMRRRACISINFAPSMIILENDGSSFFLYSSRSCFGCLPKSILLHSEESYMYFLDEILPKFNLARYLEETLVSLNQKYGGVVLPLSLTFFFTRCTDKIFGKTTYFEKGLSNADQNNCLWRVLSTSYDVRGGHVMARNDVRKRGRCNARVARRLKANFLRWLFENHDAKKNPITPRGFHASGLPLLEEYLETKISIYQLKCRNGLKLRGNKLISNGKKTKYFQLVYPSSSNYSKSLNLLSDSSYHLRVILDLNLYSWKLQCLSCQRSFQKQENLALHNCEAPQFLGEKAVTWIKTMKKTLSEDYGIENHPNFGDTFILVSLTKDDNGFKVRVVCDVKVKKTAIFEHCFQSISEIVSYLLKFLPKLAQPILAKRYVQNASQLKIIDDAYQKCGEEAKLAVFKEDERVKSWENLRILRLQMIDTLSKVVVFTHIEDVALCSLLEEVNMEIIRKMCEFQMKPSITCVKGRISVITGEGFPVQFKTLPYFAPCFSMSDQDASIMFATLCRVIKELSTQFGIDFLSCNTPCQIGRLILSESMNIKHFHSLYSPPREIQSLIKEQSRFGLLSCEKAIVHQKATMKAGGHYDFRKYYLSLLGRFSVMLGRPLTWCRNSNGKFELTRTRSRATLANLLFLLLEFVTDGVALCALFCREKRYKFPVDAQICWPDGTKKILSVCGCFYHSHAMSKEAAICHAPRSTVTKAHIDGCKTCKNAEMPHDNLRPRLFRMQEHENGDSKHPLKKEKTYREVYESSQKNLQIVSQHCGNVSHIVIHECQILHFYYSNIGEFLAHFGLPAKKGVEGAIFADILRAVASQYFPLLKVTNLSQKTIIECIKSEKLKGMCVVTAKTGPVARERLGIAKPFSMVGEEGNTASYDIDNALVPLSFLSFMLNCELIPDFQIEHISKIFEYHVTEKPIFSSAVEKTVSYMESHPDDAVMVNLLKNSMNAAAGYLGIQSYKYPSSIVATEMELSQLNPWEHLLKSVAIDAKNAILFLSKRPVIVNLAHLHFQLIYQGRQEMLHFLLKMQHFLRIHTTRINTDGALLLFQSALNENELQDETTLAMDKYLKSREISEVASYLNFKKDYFSNLGVCPAHEADYIATLSENKLYEATSCCVTHVHVPRHLKVTQEGFFDKAIVLSVNRLATYNSVTKQKIVKCSGAREERLYEMEMYSCELMETVFSNCD